MEVAPPAEQLMLGEAGGPKVVTLPALTASEHEVLPVLAPQTRTYTVEALPSLSPLPLRSLTDCQEEPSVLHWVDSSPALQPFPAEALADSKIWRLAPVALTPVTLGAGGRPTTQVEVDCPGEVWVEALAESLVAVTVKVTCSCEVPTPSRVAERLSAPETVLEAPVEEVTV